MKTRLIALALASVMGVASMSAQDKQAAYKTVYAKDGKGAHWFVELGDAATILSGGKNSAGKSLERISLVNPTLSVGRYHKPYFATRLQLSAGELKEYYNGVYGKNKYALGHLDFMWDVTEFFAPYSEQRFFHFIPFVGVGAGYRWETEYNGVTANSVRWSPTAHLGAQLKFRVSKCVDFNIEGQLVAHDLRTHSIVSKIGGCEKGYQQAEGSLIKSLGASLTLHLGKKEFTPIVPQDDALIARLNSDINALRAENAELRKRPVKCPDFAVLPIQESISVGNVVYFRLNSAVVDANQLINVRNVAEYAKNNTETITLVGYADRQTGTPDYNYKLSERRAEAVKKILVEKYGISADRIKTSWHGDREQPYAENVWNRVVIMNAE